MFPFFLEKLTVVELVDTLLCYQPAISATTLVQQQSISNLKWFLTSEHRDVVARGVNASIAALKHPDRQKNNLTISFLTYYIPLEFYD